MTLKIAAVCDNQLCGEMLKEAGKKTWINCKL